MSSMRYNAAQDTGPAVVFSRLLELDEDGTDSAVNHLKNYFSACLFIRTCFLNLFALDYFDRCVP